MPEAPHAASGWLVGKLTTQLQEAKMWPVKLVGVKHQEALSIMDEHNKRDHLWGVFV